MKHAICIFASILCILVSPAAAQIVETHEFGATNIQYFIYPDYTHKFKFAAINTMTVKSVEAKSWLATNLTATFHIELCIEDSVIATWDQVVDRVTKYTEYYHTKQVTYSLTEGDTIVYRINGTGGSPAGGLRGVNYVKLTGEKATGIELAGATPRRFVLSQNYPNPFNPTTTIAYQLPVEAYVTLKVFDLTGREVATLVEETQAAGYKSVEFNACALSSGMFLYRLYAVPSARRDLVSTEGRDGLGGEFRETKRLLLLK
jgi:hypothetical protein